MLAGAFDNAGLDKHSDCKNKCQKPLLCSTRHDSLMIFVLL
jgi:hypothetical protein